jgi:hypothetical protein
MKKKEFLLGMFGILLIFGVLFVGCDNGSTNEEVETFTRLTEDETDIELSTATVVTDVNPSGLELAVYQGNWGTIRIELTGEVGMDIANVALRGELIGVIPVKESAVTEGYSGVAIAGLFDKTKPGTIRQYNQALNIGQSANQYTVGYGTDNPYREKHYDGGTNSYYLDALGGFEILLWNGASRKTITLIITPDDEDEPAKTIVIDYSTVEFTAG